MKNNYSTTVTTAFFTMLIFASSLFAQKEQIANNPPKYILKLSLTSLIDVINTPALQFSIEQRLNSDHSLQYEVGVLSDMGNDIPVGRPLLGYRLRGEYRYYYRGFELGENSFFIGGQLEWKQSFIKRSESVSRDGGAYFQEMDYTRMASSVGAYFSWGRVFYVSDHFMLELGSSIGLRGLHLKNSNLPADAVVTNEPFTFNEGTHLFPAILLNFKLGYVFR